MLRKQHGFSVIELLTVIAIIGILAAFLFPVITSAKENAKKTQCMSNMNQIWTALKAFQQNEGRYPDFIAGPYPVGGTGVIDIKDTPGVEGGRAVSLYPEYIKSETNLYCPLAVKNGTRVEYTRHQTIPDPMWHNVSGFRGTAPAAFQVYPFSTYDVQNPRNSGQWEAHYSTVWLDPPSGTAPSNFPDPDFPRQLRWKMPPEDTVVTWCSYHRETKSNQVSPGSNDLVIFLDGHVKPMNSARLYGNGADDPQTRRWDLVWKNAKR